VRRVLAAIDSGASSPGVLAVTRELCLLFDAEMDAVHVVEGGDEAARELARRAGVGLRLLRGDPESVLATESDAPGVVAVVAGTRGARHGRRPAGHVALALAASVSKLLVLVPLDGRRESALAVRDLLLAAAERQVEVDVLHVHAGDDLPPFDDHSTYGVEAWKREFVARHCPPEAGVGAHTRVGIPEEEVLGLASERSSDLVVLAWGRDLSPDRARIVREALKRAVVPVALVPRSAYVGGLGV
jgi:hypothetical protein